MSDIEEQNIERLLAQADPPKISADARARIKEAIALKLSHKREEAGLRSNRRVLFGIGLAASVMMVLAFGREKTVLHTNDGASPILVALDDGTNVVLDRGAEMIERGERHVRLVRGQAFLDVAHLGTPFYIDAPQGRAVVTGTQLALDAREDETRTAVARGEVRLEGSEGTAILHAGDQAVLKKGARPIRTPAPRVSYLASFARAALEKEAAGGKKSAVRHGTLLARDPRGWAGEYPLNVRDFTVDVHVEDGVARTTIDQTFFNHTNMQLEGVYSFPLPPGASIARLAMYVDGVLVEGGIVERQRGRDVYESIVYQRRDPALLEWMSGNVFKVRIFPLPARSEKRIILSYTQTLEHLYDTYRLAVPMPELDSPVAHAKFDIDVADAGKYEIRSSSHDFKIDPHGAVFEKDKFKLDGDLLLSLREKEPAGVQAVRSGDYLRVQARPDLPVAPIEHHPRRWAVLLDTSASRTPRDLEAESFFASHLLAECDDDDAYTIVAFDRTQRVLPGAVRSAREDGTIAKAFIAAQTRQGIGDTDLEAAIGAALEKLGPAPAGTETVVAYIGDGMATHGETRPAELAKKLNGAKFLGVALGDKTDARLMQGLAIASGGISTSVSLGDDLAWRAFDLVATLDTARALDVKATLLDRDGHPMDGNVYGPSQLAAGESADVIARVSGEPASLMLAGTVEGKPWSAKYPLAFAKSAAAYLPRLWAQRRIDALLAADMTANEAEVTRLGLDNFLLTPFTSLLVLENDEMYKQFSVRRSNEQDWARYQAPAKITVKTEPDEHQTIDLTSAIVTRRQTQVFGQSNYWRDFDRGLRDEERSTRWRGGPSFESTIDSLNLLSKNSDKDVSETKTEWAGTFHNREVAATDIPMSLPVGAATATGTTPVADNRKLGWLGPVSGFAIDGKLKVGGKGGGGTGEALGGEFLQQSMTGAFRWSYDPRLDDLTEMLPAFFDDPLDQTGAKLEAVEASGTRGSISADARALLDRAVRPSGRYTTTDGSTVVVNGTRWQRERTLASGTVERTTWDGDTLVTAYPDLELATARVLGAAEPILFTRELPFLLSGVAPLERFYRVDLAGPNTLRVRSIGKDAEEFEIELGADLRVIRVGTLKIEYGASTITATEASGRKVTWTRTGDAPEIAAVPSTVVRIGMPLRDEAHWSAQLQKQRVGSAEWVDIQRQLLATRAAQANDGGLANSLRDIATHSGLRRADLVVGSRGVRGLRMAELKKMVSKDDVGDFLLAARAYLDNSNSTALDRVAMDHTGTLPGMLAAYRGMLSAIEKDTSQADQYLRWQTFGKRYPDPTLRWIAATNMTQRWVDPKAIGEVWDELARDPAIGWRADAAGAQILRNRGYYEPAAPRYQRAFFAALDAGEHPTFDQSFRWVLTSYTGEAGFRAFWANWRTRVGSSKDPQALISFLRGLQYGQGEDGDLERAFAMYRNLESDDTTLQAALASQLTNAGRTAEAWTVLSSARHESPDLFLLAATVAEREGRLPEAARLVLRAMDATGGKAIPLQTMRQTYQRLFDLYARVVLSGQNVDWAIDGAMSSAAQWRRDDPDNVDIDRRCAGLLFEAHRPAEAMRQLASITERHPMEGQSYADVADVLERRGQDSDAMWARAVEVEPTNPTWLLRRAQNLLAQNAPRDHVRSLLDQVKNGTWQPRFGNIKEQAKRLEASL